WAESDVSIRLWDSRGHFICILEGHEAPVLGALLIERGQQILSWSEDGTLRLWNFEGRCLNTLDLYEIKPHKEAKFAATPVYGSVVLSDGRILSWFESFGAFVSLVKSEFSEESSQAKDRDEKLSSVYCAVEFTDGHILFWGKSSNLITLSAEF